MEAPLKLIAIEASGKPAEPLGELPQSAREVCASIAGLYRAAGYEPPWIGYLARVDGALVGTCAFKGPARDGRAEIAYFTFPPYEGRGMAKRMAQALLGLAAAADANVRVVAQTLPEENASTRVLKRLGFRLAGPVQHPEDGLVWEWHKL